MKRILSLLSTIAAIFAFTACEDVPEPYVLNTTGTTSTLLNETFASSLGKFNSKSASGTLQWKNDYSSAVITGYQDFDGNGVKENQAGETYLVSPAVHLEDVDSAYVSFSQAINYEKQTIAEDHKLLISSDYANDVTTATWTEIPISFNGVGGSFTFVEQEVQIPESYIGKTVYLALKHTAHDSYSSTWEVKNFRVQRGVAGEQQPDEPSVIEGEATGTGTLEDPFNCVAAINYINSLGSDVESSENVYIKGKVVSITEQYGTQYGNATFYISDDGTANNQFQVYRALYLGNKKYTSGTQLKEGDEVIVCGKVVNFRGNTPETVTGKAYLYSLNGDTGNGDTPTPSGEATGSGTLADPYNAVAVTNFINTLGSDVESSDDVYIKGKVVSITEQYGTQYGNATFYISDDGTTANQFQVYRALYLGNTKYSSGTLLKVGDDVIVCGKVVNFRGNTPETVTGKAYLYSLNGETSPSDNPGNDDNTSGNDDNTSTVEGNTITFSAMGYDNAQDLNDKAIKVGDATLVFSKGEGSTTPKYYNAGTAMRMYGGNTLTISSDKTIKNVTIVYGEDYNGNSYYPTAENSVVSVGTYDYNDHIWTLNATSGVLTRNAQTGHFRIVSITIDY